MVLPDRIDNCLTEPVLSGNLDAGFNMGNQNQARHGRCQFVMLIFSIALVFDEIQRLLDLADVVIIPAHLCQQGVGVYLGTRRFDHGTDDNGMVVGSRCFFQHLQAAGLLPEFPCSRSFHIP